jgi:hypothetical protein
MLHRFAAASAVASVIIAVGAIVSLLPPRWPAADALILTTAWCFVPLAWGLWAMLAPVRWVPSRLPVWGAILGLVAGVIAGPVLDLPLRLGGLRGVRWLTLIVGPILYYLLWLLVPPAYRSLDVVMRHPPDAASASTRQ